MNVADVTDLCCLPAELLEKIASHLRRSRLPGIVAVFLWSRVSREMRQALAQERQCAGMDFYSGFTTVYRFRVVSFEKLIAQRAKLDVFSPVFRSGHGHEWRLLVRPRSGPGRNFVGFFLDVPGAATLPRGWARDACFRLSLTHGVGNTITTISRIVHTFEENSCDWGHEAFVSHDSLRGIDAATFGVHVTVRQRITLPSLPVRVLSLPADAPPESYDDVAFQKLKL